MASHSAELTLVKRFYLLSQRYDTRPDIARQSTMPTLTRFLHSNDRGIRKIALEAVQLLAEHPENIEYLGRDASLVKGIFHIYQEAQYDDPQLHECASLTLDALAPAFTQEDPRKAEVSRRAEESGVVTSRASSRFTETSAPLDDTDTVTVGDREPSAVTNCYVRSTSPSVVKPSEWAGEEGALPHAVTLRVPALKTQPEVVQTIERVIRSAKGVIGFTMTPAKRRVTVTLCGGKCFIEALQSALFEAGFSSVVELDVQLVNHAPTSADTAAFYPSYMESSFARKGLPNAVSYALVVRTVKYYWEQLNLFTRQLYGSFLAYSNPRNNNLVSRVERSNEVLRGNPGSAVLAGERLGRALALWW